MKIKGYQNPGHCTCTEEVMCSVCVYKSWAKVNCVEFIEVSLVVNPPDPNCVIKDED